jgi:hypothetical protein
VVAVVGHFRVTELLAAVAALEGSVLAPDYL